MKRKIIAPILALATACCCALGFAACADEPETPPEKEPEEITQPTHEPEPEPKPEADPGKVTEEQWKSLIANIKGLGEYKNFTIEVSDINSEEVIVSNFIDIENLRLYSPYIPDDEEEANVSHLVYCDIVEGTNSYGHTAYKLRDLEEKRDGFVFIFDPDQYACYEYESAKLLFMHYAGLTLLQNFKYNGKAINFEEAHEVFTYNEETKSYAAENVEVLYNWDYTTSYNEETTLVHINFEYTYLPADIEIKFKENSFSIKFVFEEDSGVINFKNFNTTEINLSEKYQQALNGQE